MGILDSMRTRATARRLRREPALVVPAGADPWQVEGYVLQWCPVAVRRGDTVLETPHGFDLHGPIPRADARWPDPGVPDRFRAAYVTECTGRDDGTFVGEAIRYHLLDGLGRRLSGLVRENSGKPWSDPAEQPAAPVVLAPRALPPEEAVGLLAPHYPGLILGYQDEDSYELYTDGVLLEHGQVLQVELTCPSVYPLVQREPWFTGDAGTTEYQLVYDTTGEGLRRMADAAWTLARATGGVVLDEDGFPWR